MFIEVGNMRMTGSYEHRMSFFVLNTFHWRSLPEVLNGAQSIENIQSLNLIFVKWKMLTILTIIYT